MGLIQAAQKASQTQFKLTHVIPHVKDLLEDVIDIVAVDNVVVVGHEHVHHPVVHLHHRLPCVGEKFRRVGIVAHELRKLKTKEGYILTTPNSD